MKLWKNWKLLIHAIKCKNKLVSPWPKFGEFLELCNSKFDIGIWSLTTHYNLLPIIDFLLQGRLGVKPLFVWGAKKCLETSICHPLHLEHDFVLKNMKTMWQEINPRFKQLGPINTLLIDDYTYKCNGNPPFSYILPQPYNHLVSKNYLLENLWPYRISLYEAQSTWRYVGLNPHGQQWLTRLNLHKKVVRDFAWSSMPLVNGNVKLF